MNDQSGYGSRHARGREAVRGVGEGLPSRQPGTGQDQGLDERWLADTYPGERPGRAARQGTAGFDPGGLPRGEATRQGADGFDVWEREWLQIPAAAEREEGGTRRRSRRVVDDATTERAPSSVAVNGAREGGRRRESHGQGRTINVSVPALRTFVTLAAVVVLSVVLSVIATITIIAVMNAGVILPQYARLNQPTQVSQLGICVSKSGQVTTPTNVGFCRTGRFVHVQPQISRP